MMKTNNFISILLGTVFVIAAAAVAGSERVDSEIPAPPVIGTTVEDFTLPDTDGKDHSLNALKGKNGTVLIFISVQCPVSNAYNERMEKLAQDYKTRGINVVGINANSTEPADVVKAHASQKHLTFAILKDPRNKIADRLGATKTPEAYFLDANNKLLYHGRIDNSKNPEGINASELRDALDAALNGKPIEKTTAVAFGCTIRRA
ncbi:MAG: thioredoxin family protein [Pyrinomonadaceae bacterium]